MENGYLSFYFWLAWTPGGVGHCPGPLQCLPLQGRPGLPDILLQWGARDARCLVAGSTRVVRFSVAGLTRVARFSVAGLTRVARFSVAESARGAK